MKLIEFGLYIATTDAELRRRFIDQTRSVCALLEHHFDGSAIDSSGWKISIQCTSKPIPNAADLGGLSCTVGDVYEPPATFDFDEFFSWNDERKRRMTFEALRKGVGLIVEAEGWPTKPFDDAFERCEADDLVYRWARKDKNSPNRKFLGRIECVHDVQDFKAWLVITDKLDGSSKRKLAIHTEPSEWYFADRFGKLRWSGSQTLLLEAKDGSTVASLSV